MSQLKIELSDASIERFWNKVDKKSDDECWEWLACKNKKGYGQLQAKCKGYLAHRVSWILHNGQIPVDLCVCHMCDNPGCVNPSHLFIGTDKDNAIDRDKKGRGFSPAGELCGNHKLKEAQVIEIREKFIPRIYTQSMLAKEYGVSVSAIQRILYVTVWKHI